MYAMEIAKRYVRRHKVLAADAESLENKLWEKYGANFRERGFPRASESLGYLRPHPNKKILQIRCSVEGLSKRDMQTIALFRTDQIEKKLPKKSTPIEREFFVIKKEIEGLIRLKKSINRAESFKHHKMMIEIKREIEKEWYGSL